MKFVLRGQAPANQECEGVIYIFLMQGLKQKIDLSEMKKYLCNVLRSLQRHIPRRSAPPLQASSHNNSTNHRKYYDSNKDRSLFLHKNFFGDDNPLIYLIPVAIGIFAFYYHNAIDRNGSSAVARIGGKNGKGENEESYGGTLPDVNSYLADKIQSKSSTANSTVGGGENENYGQGTPKESNHFQHDEDYDNNGNSPEWLRQYQLELQTQTTATKATLSTRYNPNVIKADTSTFYQESTNNTNYTNNEISQTEAQLIRNWLSSSSNDELYKRPVLLWKSAVGKGKETLSTILSLAMSNDENNSASDGEIPIEMKNHAVHNRLTLICRSEDASPTLNQAIKSWINVSKDDQWLVGDGVDYVKSGWRNCLDHAFNQLEAQSIPSRNLLFVLKLSPPSSSKLLPNVASPSVYSDFYDFITYLQEKDSKLIVVTEEQSLTGQSLNSLCSFLYLDRNERVLTNII